MTGKGLSLWPDVDIEERTYRPYSRLDRVCLCWVLVADLYYILFDGILNDNPAVGHGVDGYYFGANGEHQWYDIAKAIAVALHELGKVKTDEPTSFKHEEMTPYFGYDVRVHRS